jgi:hypothetical protein
VVGNEAMKLWMVLLFIAYLAVLISFYRLFDPADVPMVGIRLAEVELLVGIPWMVWMKD